MKIIRLQSENVKKIKAIDISPKDNTVVISGKNAQGKSSVLDSIMYALGGKSTQCDRPVRSGEKKATIECTIDGLVVKRTITESGGGTLTITQADGSVIKSPQAMLDKIASNLTFDPLAFMRLKDREQMERMRELLGIDTTELDTKRAALYAQRTEVNASHKAMQAQADGISKDECIFGEELSIEALNAELKKARSVNDKIADDKREYMQLVANEKTAISMRDELLKRLESAEKEVAACTKMRSEFVGMSSRDAIDEAPIIAKIETASKHNQKVQNGKRKLDLNEKVGEIKEQSDELTELINEIDAEKRAMIEQAKFPVQGLSFGDVGLLYNGIPFSQASSAEQLRVSVAMGIAQNPDLRVLLIRDGSLLDDDSMKIVSDIAKSNDYQVWIERVGDDSESAIIIDDGEVA